MYMANHNQFSSTVYITYTSLAKLYLYPEHALISSGWVCVQHATTWIDAQMEKTAVRPVTLSADRAYNASRLCDVGATDR